MNRAPASPCAGGCGKDIRTSGPRSLPPGQRMCQPCRRARRAPRSCAVCDVEFSPKFGRRHDAVTCSAACDNRYRRGILTADPQAALDRQRNRYRAKCRARRLRAGRTWDGVTDEQILDRDGWRCGICTRKINRRAHFPHPDSKSVDHIVPLCEGGDDTAVNKQAAHLGCNMRKGAKAFGQLSLFGRAGSPRPPRPSRRLARTCTDCGTEMIRSRCYTCHPKIVNVPTPENVARGKKAAELRMMGMKWQDVADAIGVKNTGHAYLLATKYGCLLLFQDEGVA